MTKHCDKAKNRHTFLLVITSLLISDFDKKVANVSLIREADASLRFDQYSRLFPLQILFDQRFARLVALNPTVWRLRDLSRSIVRFGLNFYQFL